MESNVQAGIMLALSKTKKVKIWRNNTGMGWVGKLVSKSTDKVILEHARVLHAGLCTGSSDLIGFTVVEITKDMVGKKLAVFTAIEVKDGKKKPSDEQENFIKIIKESGGFAGVANSEKSALEIINPNLL